MLDRYDQSELLALIEGELDPATAAALERRLASDPRAASHVQAMVRDRAALRAMEEPVLPTDFISTIEPMLSRPMLIEPVAEVIATVPGEFRRQHRRRQNSRRWTRFVAAAALLLAATGGMWVAYENWDTWVGRTGFDTIVATNDAKAKSSANRGASAREPDRGSVAIKDADALGPGVIHHDIRPRIASNPANVSTARPDSKPPAPRGEPTTLLADFAVVVSGPDAAITEERFTGVIASAGPHIALIRNFKYAEAQSLAEEFRIAHGASVRDASSGGSDRRAASTAPAVAPGTLELADTSMSRTDMHLLAQRVREQLQSRGAAGSISASVGGDTLLAGVESLSPTLEQQLDFSSRGATHTIAIPASELVALIERIALTDPANANTSLRMLSSASSSASADSASNPSALVWLSDGPLVKQAMQRLIQTQGDAIVLLPVIVR